MQIKAYTQSNCSQNAIKIQSENSQIRLDKVHLKSIQNTVTMYPIQIDTSFFKTMKNDNYVFSKNFGYCIEKIKASIHYFMSQRRLKSIVETP